MSSGRTFKLATGYTIPAVGLGTWVCPPPLLPAKSKAADTLQQSKPNEVARAVEEALRVGYRHIDAAATYDNEQEVGAAIKASGVPRAEIFLTSKLWNTHHKAEDVEEAVDESLRDLQTDYLDLYLIHWPVAFKKPEKPRARAAVDPRDGGVRIIDVPVEETWRAMEKMVEKGKIRSIGLSNFTRERIEEVLSL
jgi:L-glyceraldehyde reductase